MRFIIAASATKNWKWLDAGLMLAMAVGCIVYVQMQTQLSRLRQEQARIDAVVGAMKIDDPRMMHIRSLDSQEPWQWAWRVFQPDGTHARVSYMFGNSGSGGGTTLAPRDEEFIGRVGFLQTEAGNMAFAMRMRGGSGFSSFGSPDGILLWIE